VSSSSIRFDIFELRPDSNELFKGGSKMKLKPQAVRVLGILTRRVGEAVAREEIRSALWGSDTFVDFDASLNSCITQKLESASPKLYVSPFSLASEARPRRPYGRSRHPRESIRG